MVAGLFALLGFASRSFATCPKSLAATFRSASRGSAASVTRPPVSSAAVARPPALIGIVGYGVLGAVLYLAGAYRLFGIWTGWLVVAGGILVCILLINILFESEGPIWAIAKLSFKEAIPQPVSLALPCSSCSRSLFQNVWMSKTKPADEFRTLIVRDLSGMTLLVLVLGLALRVVLRHPQRHQEPEHLHRRVQAGRAVRDRPRAGSSGYVALMTLVLVGLTGMSLVLIANTRSRTKGPRGDLQGPGAGPREAGVQEPAAADFEGTNVGREFDYRTLHRRPPRFAPAGDLAVRRYSRQHLARPTATACRSSSPSTSSS